MVNESLKLSFRRFEVIKANLQKVKKKDGLEEENNLGFLFKIVPNKNKGFDKINVVLGVQIEPSEDFSYSTEAVLRGDFTISDGIDDEEKLILVTHNAPAILYPYLRAYVTMLTSQLSAEQIVLPVMNFHKIIEAVPVSELMVDASSYEEISVE